MASASRRRPIAFWVTITVLAFLLYSGAKATATANACGARLDGQKHWVVFPGEWECGPGGLQLLRDR